MNKHVGALQIGGLLSLLVAWDVSFAQDESANLPFNLSDIVVTAGRIERPLADTPVRTQLLDNATIEKLHTRDLRDALRIMPGVQLREVHGKTGEQVYLQGFDGNRVLILIDGLPVTATTGSTVDVSQVSSLDIERIEIVPGAGSSQYGSAAMGGVINVITRKAESRSGGRIRADVGTFGEREIQGDNHPGERHLAADVHSELAGFNWKLSVDQRQADDFDLDKDTYRSNGFNGEKSNYQVGVSHQSESMDHRLILKRFIEDTAYRTEAKGNFKAKKFEQLDRDHVSLHNQWSLSEAHSLAFSGLYESQQDKSDQLKNDPLITAGNLYRDAKTHQKKATFQWRWLPQQWGAGLASVVSGVEWYQEDLSQNKAEVKLSATQDSGVKQVDDLGNGTYLHHTEEVKLETRSTTEAFVQSTVPLNNDSELSLGTRWQNDSRFGNHTAPSLNIRHGFEMNEWSVQLRGGVAAGYRAPNLKESYFEFDHSVNGYKVLGSEDLTPEKSRSVQTSLNITDNNSINVEFSAFHNRITDLIEAVDTGRREDNGRVAIYQSTNFPEAMTRGYGVSVQHSPIAGFQQQISFNYLDSRDLEKHQALPNRSRRSIKLLLLWDISYRWNITLSGEYQSEFYTDVEKRNISPGYQRWDVKTDFNLNKTFGLYGGINNFNDIVRNTNNASDRRPSRGRFPYVGLSYSF
ncbi:MAG: TonB-dependent receptor [Saccharospirillaceae bacterium]|nr:hypothetical protein A3759_14255 [Thalassolituus sp. HI0120]MCH2041362.1 TonB-dependent receptor [Saccharospirillaceae bacterium]